MPRLISKTPKYALHAKSGRARVRIDGREVWLDGPHGSPESRQHYDRVVAEWLSAGRRLPPSAAPQAAPVLTVCELAERYLSHCQTYYRHPTGEATSEARNVQYALRPLLVLYGRTPAASFSPLALRAVQARLVADGRVRKSANQQVGRIVRMFKWAASLEMIPAGIHEAIKTVPMLKAGRCDAPDRPAVGPVDPAVFETTLPRVPNPHMRALLTFARWTGCRIGEACILRLCDLDRSNPAAWVYHPRTHKTAYRRQIRAIPVGARAQAAILPLLREDQPEAPVFCPRIGVELRRAERTARRKTPLSCGNRPGTNRKARPKRTPGEMFTVGAVAKAVNMACKAAAIPSWHPHQLRHLRASELRSIADPDTARATLGHAGFDATAIYAQADIGKAAAVAAMHG